MFYRMYLSSVCNRRQWPEPIYEPYTTRHGHFCKVRVNNREYGTDVPYTTPELAQDAAATKAFMICRNFSKNDGRMPGQRPGQSSAPNGVVQGLPVAIGTGRRNARRSDSGSSSADSDGSSDGGNVDALSLSSASSSLGGISTGSTSPKAMDGGFKQQMLRPQQHYRPQRQQRQQKQFHNSVAPRHHHQPPPLLPRRGAHQTFSRAPGPTAVPAVGATLPPGSAAPYACPCRRARVRAYGRCDFCLRENGLLA